MGKFVSLFRKKTVLLGAVLVLAVAGTALGLSSRQALANDCSSNAIMRCGAANPRDFIAKINAHASPNLGTIYSAYNLVPSEYSRFASSAKAGMAYKDGTIKVDGRIVGHNSESIGRTHFSYAHPKVIGGITYWESRAQDVFLSNSIPVMVLFNQKGDAIFAVMYDCGNPNSFVPNNPTYSCKNLNEKQVDRDTFQFSTNASAGNGASINHVVYDFGDGHTQSESNPSKVITHTYAKSGSYTAKVTVYVNVPGSQTYAIAAAGNCVKHITVAPAPEAACEDLKAIAIDRNSYRLTAQASTAHGATISAYDFTVKNSAGHVVASPSVRSSATEASTTVNLNDAGTYNAQVSVQTSLGAKTGNQCKTSFTVSTAPQAACEDLKAIVTDRTKVALTATASASNGATISAYDFVVKNANGVTVASPTVQTAAKTATANVNLTAAGNYNAAVTVKTSLGDKTGTQCQTSFTIKPAPAAACESLSAITVDRTHFTLKAQASASNGATISAYDFAVTNSAGNVVAQQHVPSADTSASTNVTLNDEGTYNAQVTVQTSLGPVTSDSCATTLTVKPAPKPGVTITKHVDNVKREQVNVGQPFEYELVVTNTGAVDLTNAVVTDTPPQGVTLLSADSGSIANNQWSYTIPSLAVGKSKSFKLTAKVTEYMQGDLVNTACVNAPEVNPEQPNKPDSCDTATVTVTPPQPKNPNITITKTVDGQKSEQVVVGQHFTYQLVIKNTGEIDLTNAVVTDTPPQGVTLLNADLGAIANNNWSYSIPSLKVGESVTVNIVAVVNTYVAGSMVNTACVNAPEVNPEQPTQPDACDTAIVTVTPPTVTPPPVTPPAVLPNTGAGNVIGIFAGVVIASTIGYRVLLARKLARR